MLFLILTIFLHALIFSAFKIFGRRSIDTFQAIVVNYFVCVITGALFAGPERVLSVSDGEPWLYTALGLGLLFISTFYVMAMTSQKISMAASSIASKMSVIIPVLFSVFILKVNTNMDWLNYIGISLAIPATWMSAQQGSQSKINRSILWLPLAAFLGNGAIDVIINYSTLNLLHSDQIDLFPIFSFLSAAVIGGIILLFRGKPINPKAVIAGILLGIINYFSIYFLLLALDTLGSNGALVFPLFNTGIIVLTSLIGVLIFHEHLSKVNKTGIILAIVSIALILLF